jgi:hypothetical protein
MQPSPSICSFPLFSKSTFFRGPHTIFSVNWSVWNHLSCDENMLLLRSAVIDGDRGLRFRIMFKFMELKTLRNNNVACGCGKGDRNEG